MCFLTLLSVPISMSISCFSSRAWVFIVLLTNASEVYYGSSNASFLSFCKLLSDFSRSEGSSSISGVDTSNAIGVPVSGREDVSL